MFSNPSVTVRRENALVHSGKNSRTHFGFSVGVLVVGENVKGAGRAPPYSFWLLVVAVDFSKSAICLWAMLISGALGDMRM